MMKPSGRIVKENLFQVYLNSMINTSRGGSAFNAGAEPVRFIEAFFDAAPPRSKGFCSAKTLFRCPHSFSAKLDALTAGTVPKCQISEPRT
jgi:hypothetical protein